MLRSEVDILTKNLLDAIDECEIPEIIASILKNEDEMDVETALNAFRKFLEITQSYSTNEHKLIKGLGLEKLRNSAFWASILRSSTDTARETIQHVATSIELARHYVPVILSLTAPHQDLVDLVSEEGEKVGIKYVNLSVLVVEEEDLSTPKRLIFLLEAIQGLYDLVGRLQDKDTMDLYVIGCESGEDKQFDFYGNAEIIEGVKEIILTLWDRVVFYRKDKTGKQLDLMVESIPIIDKITEMEQSGSLEKEESEILRRLAASSAKKFSQAGVTIPEMEEAAKYDPRALMHPDRRILSAPDESGMVFVPEEEDPDELDIPQNLSDPKEAETPEDREEFVAPEAPAEPEPVVEEAAPETPAEPEAGVEDDTPPTWEEPEDLVKPEEAVDLEVEEEVAAAPETPEESEPESVEEPVAAAEPEVLVETEPTENPFGDLDTPSVEPVEEFVAPEAPEVVVEEGIPEAPAEPEVVVEEGIPEAPAEDFKTVEEKPEAQTAASEDEDEDAEELIAADGIPSLEELIEADPAVDSKEEKPESAAKDAGPTENIYARIAEEYLAKMRQDAAGQGSDDSEKD